jgi:hypothetical protein
MTAHTPDGGGLTEAEFIDNARRILRGRAVTVSRSDMGRVWDWFAARATHADPRETAAAALEEALAAHPPTYTERAADPQTFYCPPCSEAIGDWVTWTPAHVAADLRAGVREGRDT